MIMSIIIAIVGGIILAFGYLVFEPDTIIQIIALLAGWGCLIFAGLCFIYWIFTTLKDNDGGNSSHSSSYHNSYSNRHSSSQSYNDSTSSNLKRPDGSLEIDIARSIDNHLPANTPSTNISCRIYGNTISISGCICLWHSSDLNRLSSSISSGINAALERASSQGYDIYDLNNIDTSGLEISAVND